MKAERDAVTRATKTPALLLDAAERLMLDEGYAAVTTRRLAAEASVNSALVYYHFQNMDNLFVELFRRGSDRSFQRQAEALASPQPLWALWDAIHDQTQTALIMEFVALANHRKAIKAEIAVSSRKFRRLQLEALTKVLDGYGTDPRASSPEVVILMMSSVSRFLRIEESFGVDIGHAAITAVVEGFIRDLEGERHSHEQDAATAGGVEHG